MFKTSFAVAIHREKKIILGVTSIVPNLNGILFFTENRWNYQLEDEPSNNGFNIEYDDNGEYDFPDDYKILDYRAKD